jgi:hypothetical protein
MGRWMRVLRTTHGSIDADLQAKADDGCPVCDHPFGHLSHACISSIGPTRTVLVPEAVVA